MSTKTALRDTNGRFVMGHAGGPGRPRRPVEQEYLATLNKAVSLDVWQQIVERAVEDALSGDGKARDWLTKYLIGEERSNLVQLAADERAGLSVDVTIETLAVERQQEARHIQFQAALRQLLSMPVERHEINQEQQVVG